VRISKAGLKARHRLNSKGDDETGFLEFVEEAVVSGRVPADELLAKYEKAWEGDIRRIYTEYAF
jgi:glutamate--cysteine ligase